MAANPDLYRPPFTTETDEARWDDCAVCSALHMVATWTTGSVVTVPRGREMSRAQRRTLREHMRNHLPADKQTGGLTVADVVAMVEAEWSWLPALLPFRRSFDNLWTLLDDGYVCALWGNPAEVVKPISDLRTWTANDDFGHVITVLDTRTNDGVAQGFVMDPLGSGAYDGEWVPRNQIRQFAYLKADGTVRSCIVVKRGAQSEAARARQDAKTEAQAEMTALQARITDLEAALIPVEDARAAERERTLDAAVAAVEALR